MMSRIGNRSFTLIEIMVTTVIFVLGVLLIYQAFFISLDSFNYCLDYLRIAPCLDETIWQAQDSITHFNIAPNLEPACEFILMPKDRQWEFGCSVIDKNQNLYRINLRATWRRGKKDVSISRIAYAMYTEQK
ncbi:MAG: prepilin-type N-terminal cleavage/methylation domain-containing protein [Candidatus Omnitrophica bacterium]|nr:prepilin-type N-terminal cleavage/methylation domain-containing protein [Candidatus Omnitrophota bacterium]